MSPFRVLLGFMCVAAVLAASIEDPETLQAAASPSAAAAAEAPLTPSAVITPASSTAAERLNGFQAPMIDTTAHAIIPSGAQTVVVQKTLKGVQLEPGRVAPLVVYPRYLTKQAESDGCPCSGQNSRILNIMSFNILRDLDDCPFPKPHCINALAEKILAYQVDVAGFQEVTRWLRSGWTILEQVVEILNKTRPFEYTAIPFTTIITRLPVVYVDKWFSPGGSGAILELAPGVNMAFYTAHVVAYPYGPYELRDHAHKGVKAVKAIYKQTQRLQLRDTKKVLNRIRRLHRNSDVQEALANQLGGASSVRKDNYAIVVTGDYNIPSHLDHTIAVSKSNFYNQARGFKALPFPWPVSMYFDYWKYRDAYREFYPDPIAKPGFTWTSMPDKREVYDRIDYIFLRDHSHKYSASKKHIEMQVVEAKRIEPVVITPDGQAGFFSDHRGVFSRVQFTWPEGRGGDDGPSERVLRAAAVQRRAAAAQLRRAEAASASPAAQESTASAPKMRASMAAATVSAQAEIEDIA